jgi:hypothetical protein
MSALKPFAALACAVVLIGATHDSDQAALAKQLAGRVPGQPVNCIDLHNTEGPTVINKRTLLYRSFGTIYRNELPSECRSMTDYSTIIVDVYGGQLCEHDHFRTREPGDVVPSAFCFLGKFTPYTLPKKH